MRVSLASFVAVVVTLGAAACSGLIYGDRG